MNIFKNKTKEKIIESEIVRQSHKGRYIFLFFLLLTIIGMITLYKFAQRPAEGLIKSQTQETINSLKESDVPKTFNGKYISFMYGSKYILKSDDFSKDSADVVLERAYLSEVSTVSKKINLTIRSLPSQNLTDDPDYLLRQNNPEHYKKENFFFGGVSGVSFVPADGHQFEKTFFILHNDIVVTLVMSAPGFLDKTLSEEADSIVKSLAWLK